MTDILYAAVAGDAPRLSCFRLSADGPAQPPLDVPLPGTPADLAVSPDGRFLYADINVDGVHQALSFAIDPSTGGLTSSGSPAHVGPYPCYIAVDRSGRFLLAAYYADGMVTVHAIGADGVVGERVQQLPTQRCAHCIQTDAFNRFAFVPHVGEENAVWQFRFDESTGQLTPNDPPKASPEPGQGPRHLCFHPSWRLAFTNGEQGSSVTSWSYDAETGTLEALETLSTLPADWSGKNTCSQLHLTPDGRFLYSGNRGHDSLAGFAVDPGSGALRALGQVPAEPNPRPTAISPDGHWLFNSGNSPQLTGYRIDQLSGALSRELVIDSGPVAWLLATRLG